VQKAVDAESGGPEIVAPEKSYYPTPSIMKLNCSAAYPQDAFWVSVMLILQTCEVQFHAVISYLVLWNGNARIL